MIQFLGVTKEPLSLMYNWFSVNLGMVHVLMPFLILPLYSVMTRIDMNLVRAAEGLGASKFQSFLRVYFPLSLPGVMTGSILVFILSLGFYITPGGKVTMIAVFIEQQINQFLNWGLASALSVIILVVTVIFLVIYNCALRWDKKWI